MFCFYVVRAVLFVFMLLGTVIGKAHSLAGDVKLGGGI